MIRTYRHHGLVARGSEGNYTVTRGSKEVGLAGRAVGGRWKGHVGALLIPGSYETLRELMKIMAAWAPGD